MTDFVKRFYLLSDSFLTILTDTDDNTDITHELLEMRPAGQMLEYVLTHEHMELSAFEARLEDRQSLGYRELSLLKHDQAELGMIGNCQLHHPHPMFKCPNTLFATRTRLNQEKYLVQTTVM